MKVSLYLIASAILAANAGLLALTHHNPEVAALLGGLSVLGTVAHGFFVSTNVVIPTGVYSFLEKFNGFLVGITGASAIIVAWVSSLNNNSLSTDAAVILTASSLLGGILAQIVKPQLAKAARAVAHG
ncbi:MAG: hypothetical protein WBF51_04135 [Candidatus Dormiibacterota bacterium]